MVHAFVCLKFLLILGLFCLSVRGISVEARLLNILGRNCEGRVSLPESSSLRPGYMFASRYLHRTMQSKLQDDSAWILRAIVLKRFHGSSWSRTT